MDDPAQSRLERQRHESEGGHPEDQRHQDEGNAAVEAQEAQGHTYGVINISGNAQAILGNVHSSQGDFFRHMDHANSRTMLIKALYFEGMQSRKQQISARAGSPKHIEWVWSTNFLPWLEGSGSFFWITGLPGSGKSTLMRHICESRMTIDALQKSGHKWTTLHFFFDFRAGDGLANSIAGMLRALLYQLVKRLPEVADQVDHRLFTDVSQLNNLDACLDNLCEAVRSTTIRVCAFIDGLDEFEGSAARLLEVIHTLEDRAEIKLCLASRPYPIFKNNLSNQPHLVMQDHNDESIRLYTESQWQAHRIHASLPRSLSDRIREKARGIFLWARLATDELYRDCIAGKSVEELEEQLELMPKEVEEMYQRILDRLPGALRLEAALLLYIISGEKEHIQVRKLYVALQAMVGRLGPAYSVIPIDLDDTNVPRILAVLGDFLEISTGPYIKAPPSGNSSIYFKEYLPPRVTFEKQRIQIQRDKTAQVSLTHETLSSFLSRGCWLRVNLPTTVYNASRRYFWLDLYLEELSTHLVPENAEAQQLKSTISTYIERTETDLLERSYSLRQHETGLLSLLNMWPRWTPLLPFALQQIVLQLDDFDWHIRDKSRFVRVQRIISSEIILLHCAICIFLDYDGTIPSGNITVGFKRGCAYYRSWSPFGICRYANQVGWDIAVMLGHGHVPYIEARITQDMSMSSDQRQDLFDLLWKQIISSPHHLINHQACLHILHALTKSGCEITGAHLCVLFEYVHPFADGSSITSILDMIVEHLRYEKLEHSHTCAHFSPQAVCSSFLCHWAASSHLPGKLRWQRRLLKMLLDHDQDIDHVCGVTKQTVLGAILADPCMGPSQFEQTLSKLIIALQIGADPLQTGTKGTAFDAAKASVYESDVIGDATDDRFYDSDGYLDIEPPPSGCIARRMVDILDYSVTHSGVFPPNVEEYVEIMMLEARYYGKDGVFTSLEALVNPENGKLPLSYVKWALGRGKENTTT